MKDHEVSIVIPNDLGFVPLIIEMAGSLAKKMGFPANEIKHIEIGAEEAISNIIKFAFEVGEETTIGIRFYISKLGLEIVISEKGLPFDPSLVPEFSPEKFKEDLSENGLGMYLMKQFMDEFSFHNLGKEGKETRLFKYLSTSKVEDIISEEDLKNAQQEREAETLPRGSVSYTIRRMRPEEAVEVSRCAYTSYGYTYVHEDVYYPDRLRALNESEDVISFVAVTGSGEIISHAALEREDDRGVPQLGIAATKPRYRGQGCLGALNKALIQDAIDRKFMGAYARGITTHVFSQKSIFKMDMQACGILISSGMEREYKAIEQKKIQRESVVIAFRYLNKPDKQEIFVPGKHAAIIKDIYGNLGFLPLIKTVENTLSLPETATDIVVAPKKASLTADITITTYGADVLSKVQEELRALCQDRFETIYLHLRLKDPLTAVLTPEFERLDFFFAGVMPHTNENDVLILQYLNNHTIDYDCVNVGDAFSEKLKAYIKEHDVNLKN